MIILEGPDGAGKTTLIKQLAEKYSLPIAPRVVSKDAESMIVSLKAWVEDNVSQGFQATLFDRHRLISEPIYGAVLRKTFEPGFDSVQWLHAMNTMFYKHCRPMILYCLPPFEVVKANVQNDENNKVVKEAIRKIYALYTARAAQDAVLSGALIYDYTSTPIDHIFGALEASLNRREHV